ncbi:transmembrane channel-like protein 5 [Polyodon spathula]|uniref:transmembrane channel-like protein 5 n=1 Tax=Polyodon spathula TaxID=7913 RepID=UPI001B7E2998|nr:transmembrane channel-like protein 5 [Polyodon spathula]XP_041085224.1 transmembrane channel-like protein 5 [Polyodon spathula]XP_041085225.1 transmembrane channel-like protein 5 [Polyodon spathula]
MSQQNRDGGLNPVYHHSVTLETDSGSPRRSQQQNPYASEDFRPRWGGGPARRDGPEVLPPYDIEWRRRDTTETIPMRPLPSEQGFGRPYPSTSLINTQKIKGESAVRRYSLFPAGTLSGSTLGRLGFKEDEFQDMLEEERQDLVRELAAMSSKDCHRGVRQLPMSLREKDHIRKTVLLVKTSKKHLQEQNCCTDCTQNVSMSFRRCGASLSAVPQALQPWQGTLKEIGGKFGTSVLSYFLFLKWLLMFNIFSFLVNFGFVTVPQLLDHKAKNTGTFQGLEILTGAGYFSNSVLYYGFYSNGTVSGGSASSNSMFGMPQYNMQLAYFFTIIAYLVLCCISLVYSAARSFRNNFMLAGAVVGNAGRLLCSWDFSVINEKAVHLRQDNLCTQLKESLSETCENLSLTSQKFTRFGIHVAAWFVSTGMAAGCCAGVYFLCLYNMKLIDESHASQSLTAEAGTLLLPIVVSLINLVIPLLYSLFKKVEPFTLPRHQIYALIVRNVLLKMSILAMLCYFWLEEVVESDKIRCWETFVGQDIYRLVIIDFIFCLLGSLFGEFLHKVIGTKCLSSLGVLEFDIARNVLDLIYAQTLAWIGIFFSPLLPVIQIIKLFLIFYLKKVSLMQNCHPPQRSWRGAQMMTAFILLLFFPSFSGALSVVAITFWRRAPSKTCGPFRGLAVPYDAVSQWIDSMKINFPRSSWVVWIYNNLIKSVLFFLILTLLVLILIYLFWQIVVGRKVLIALLQEQISNEGKDKTFLLEKIEKLKAQRSAQPAQRGGAEESQRTGSKDFKRSRRRSQDLGSRGSERRRVSSIDQGSRSPGRGRVPGRDSGSRSSRRGQMLGRDVGSVSPGRGRVPEYEPSSGERDIALPGYVQEGQGATPLQALLARRQAKEEDEEEGY